MRDHRRRLARIEARLHAPDERVAWVAVDAAAQRQRARARLKICRLLGVNPDDRRVQDALALLVNDSSECIAQDAALVQRWHRQAGIVTEPGEAHQRLSERLEAIAQRLRAAP